MKIELLQALNDARAKRRSVALVTDLDSGAQRLVSEGDALGEGLDAALVDAFARDEAQRAKREGGGSGESQGLVFIQPYLAPLRLFVVGGVHIAQELVPMAQRAGYAIAVIDPRGEFASAERFGHVALEVGPPDERITSLGADSRTAIVTLTHLPNVDDLGLTAALRSRAFYIGALGSSRTHALRCERLAEQGFTAEEIGRIHGPVGLDIGARTPAEIAISILAEITLTLRGAKGRMKA